MALRQQSDKVVEAAEPYFDTGCTPTNRRPNKERFPRAILIPGPRSPRGFRRWIREPDCGGLFCRCACAGDRQPGCVFAVSVEVWTCDANDNAGATCLPNRGHTSEDLARGRMARSSFASHVDTPSSIVLDALGRTVQATQRLTTSSAGGGWLTFSSRYDIVGNLIEYRDPLNRVVQSTIVDHIKRPIKTTSLDAGEHVTCI